MKRAELLKHATCSLCNLPIGKSGLPLFWKVTVERFGLDVPAIQRQDGMGQMMGGHHGLAAFMGPDEDMAKSVMDPAIATICETCATGKSTLVAILAEVGRQSGSPA
jgi:hypothetical protein